MAWAKGMWAGTPRALGRLFLCAATLVAVAPVVFAAVLAFRSTQSIDKSALALPHPWTLHNFSAAWTGGALGPSYVSSLICTVVAVAFLVTAGQALAYVTVRHGGRSAPALFVYVLVGLMIPFPTRVLPLFTLMSSLHLTGSVWSIIIFQCGSLMPLSVLLFSGFLRRLPVDYEEAAYLDGAGPVRTFWSIIVPLLRPCSGAVATLAGLIIWNDFFTPLILAGGSSAATLPVAVYSFVGQYTSQWGEIFAGLLLASLPVIVMFVVFQKYVVVGLSSGIKG